MPPDPDISKFQQAVSQPDIPIYHIHQAILQAISPPFRSGKFLSYIIL